MPVCKGIKRKEKKRNENYVDQTNQQKPFNHPTTHINKCRYVILLKYKKKPRAVIKLSKGNNDSFKSYYVK